MTEPVDYAVFYEQLAELVTSRETGTLYLKNDRNHVAIVGVRAGKVVSLVCGPRRGRSAVELIRETRTGTVRLDCGALAFHEHELPSTDEILDLLSPLHAALAPAERGHADAPGPGTAKAAGNAQILCNLLTEYLGPVAPLICDETICSADGLSGSRQLDQVIQGLAQEIEDPGEAREFTRRARQALDRGDEKETAGTGLPGPPAVDVAALKDRLCDLLTNYLGPVAPLVCDENFSALGDGVGLEQLERMIANIAAEIGDDQETAKFVTEARQQMAALTR